jgi:hypothetical protein
LLAEAGWSPRSKDTGVFGFDQRRAYERKKQPILTDALWAHAEAEGDTSNMVFGELYRIASDTCARW